MSDTVLDVRNLQVQFLTEAKPVVAVDGISFTLQRGQTLGIVGESGSGKSVTSLAIMGLIGSPGLVSQGEIWFRQAEDSEGINLVELNDEAKRRYRGGQISMIFQEPMSSLNPVYTIGFQLVEAIRMHQEVSETEAKAQAIARLQEVQLIPSEEELRQQYREENPDDENSDLYVEQQKQAMLKRYPHELSGGQLQRVMIAMAISCEPTILIADEPTTALDVTVQATILKLLKELCNKRQMSLIFITHDLGVIAEIADAVAVMYRGKIVESEAIEQILFDPQHPYTRGLLACRPRLDRRLKYLPTVSDFMREVENERGEFIIKEKVATHNTEIVEPAELEQRLAQLKFQDPLISIQNLRVGFPQKGMFGRTKRHFMAVKGVSFQVYPGETLGLVGESGCGKSTLARAILRLIPALSGEIRFDGVNLADLKRRSHRLRRLRRQMQVVFQNPYSSLNPRLSIGKAIAEPMVIHNQFAGERQDRVAQLLERVGLKSNLMNRYPHEFSGGQRQRICIARALALDPQFIICDESVSALDVSVQAQVLNLLKQLQAELGLTYIFISHDLSVVKFMSDRILVMNRGQIEEEGSAEAIYNHPQKEYTRQLIASIPTGGFEEKPQFSSN